jgi:hypothetical protein
MFDRITRWITLPDPVRFAGWCGGLKEPVLGPRLEHQGGTTGDLEIVEFCDENFGTSIGITLHQRCEKHRKDYEAGHGCEGEYIEECDYAFARACKLACKTLKAKGIDVVVEDGTSYLELCE